MPRIPTITKSVVQMPTISAQAVATPAQARAEMGQAVAGIGNTVGNIYSSIQVKRQAAADLVNLATTQNNLEDFKLKLAEDLKNETDFNNISEDQIDEKINTFRDEYSKLFKDNTEAGLKFNNIVSAATRELKKVANARYDTLITDQAKLDTEKYLDREIQNYITAPDEQKEGMLDNVSVFLNGMAENNAYSKSYAYERGKKWLADANALIEKDQTKRDAYEVDALVQKADTMIEPEKSDETYDLEARYKKIEELTDNPAYRKAAYDELNRLKKIHDDAQKERYDNNVNQIVGVLQSNKYFTINDMKKLPAYADLSETQRGIVQGKIQNLLDQRDREERSVAAAERSAETAERTRINQEKKEQQEKYDKAYDTIMSNETSYLALGTISEGEFNALILDVGESNQAKLLQTRLKLQKENASSSPLSIARKAAYSLLDNAKITDPGDRSAYWDAVRTYIGGETDPAIIRKKVAEAMQNAAMDRHLFRKDKVIINAPK
jgi:hypothetical protein